MRTGLTNLMVSAALVSVILVSSCLGSRSGTSNLPEGFAESLYVAGSAENPTVMRFAPDGRLFVADQGGRLWVIKDGKLLPEPFLQVWADFSPVSERGLVGLEFHPDYERNGYVYVYYTVNTHPAYNRLSRFTANPDDPDRAIPTSEKVLLDLPPLLTAFHNGGALRFGRDGKLYVGTGDNAGQGEPQSLRSLFGKILRLNDDGSSPDDNPFVAETGGVHRAIWALGIRNAFAFDIDPRTGKLMINDTGELAKEEINEGVAGSNYGWNKCEGPCEPRDPGYRDPIYSYGHEIGPTGGCAIDGGTFYRPKQRTFPERFVGKYFFLDFCSPWIKMLDPETGEVEDFATNLPPSDNASATLVSLEDGPDGALYFISRFRRSIYRIQYTGKREPSIGQHPADQVVARGRDVTLEVRASGAGPLGYRWQHNGRDLPRGDQPVVTISGRSLSAGRNRIRVVVKNRFGSATSRTANVTVAGLPPKATITDPREGATAGLRDVVLFKGSATDPEDGVLPAQALGWRIDLHHDEHTHPVVRDLVGVSGSFPVSPDADTSGQLFFRITLKVRDSSGLETTLFRDVKLEASKLTIRTEPPGLVVKIDGLAKRTPLTASSVVGSDRPLEAVSPQTLGGVRYVFDSWSDGGASTHAVSTPAGDATYIARFRRG